MTLYITPNFGEDNLYEKETVHYLNLFCGPNIFSTKERILKILKVNESVFSKESGYIHDILQLSKTQGIHKNFGVEKNPFPPKWIYKSYIPSHLLQTSSTQHHIIFKNDALKGHKSHKSNLIEFDYGEHGSFHRLLKDKNIFPHQQMSRFISHEKEIFENGFIDEIQQIEQYHHELFMKNPLYVYKREAFSDKFWNMHSRK